MLGLAAAPEINRLGLHWFNVSRPLSLSDLSGRLVVLDFWTACCVNCLHVLPTLRRLEETFPDTLAVIGVNSPKYPAEQHPDSLAAAIARHDIRHPVVHDPELHIWRDYGIQAWPTLVFIDPHGRILGHLPGEPEADKLLAGIGQMLRRWRGATPRPLPLRIPEPTEGRFRFPAKIKPVVAGCGGGKQWAIADSGHHQVVLCDDHGHELRRFGRGRPGFVDLPGEGCAFSSPQGLCSDGERIYVADTGNHAVRRIDLATGAVTTLAGTGKRGSLLAAAECAHDACLAAPWDVECWGNRLFFANAGTHQLGCLDLAGGMVWALAGSGEEDLVDGAAAEANLAQPTGLALDRTEGLLYFVDSETSSVRVLTACEDGRVETLVGAGLFECGKRNGDFAQARMQHCRGIAWRTGGLVIADTYNGLVRVLDLASRRVAELGGGEGAWSNGIRLTGGEPAGIAADGDDRLLICDTNHHRIVEFTCGTRSEARVWAA